MESTDRRRQQIMQSGFGMTPAQRQAYLQQLAEQNARYGDPWKAHVLDMQGIANFGRMFSVNRDRLNQLHPVGSQNVEDRRGEGLVSYKQGSAPVPTAGIMPVVSAAPDGSFAFASADDELRGGAGRDQVRRGASLDTMTPAMRAVVSRAMEITQQPFGMYPIGGGRTPKEQDALKKAGWSKVGGEKGQHVQNRAVDLIPIVNGVAAPKDDAAYAKIRAAMTQASKELGVPLRFGADFKGFPDKPHYEVSAKDAAAYVPDPNAQYAVPQSLDFSPEMQQQLAKAGYQAPPNYPTDRNRFDTEAFAPTPQAGFGETADLPNAEAISGSDLRPAGFATKEGGIKGGGDTDTLRGAAGKDTVTGKGYGNVPNVLKSITSRAMEISKVPMGMIPSGGARTPEEQDALNKAGWSGLKGNKGTHVEERAIDLIPVVNGQLAPNDDAGYAEAYATMLDAQEAGAVAASTGFVGTCTKPSVTAVSVTLCDRVNAVTVLTSFQPPWVMMSSARMNRRWSTPVRMCSIPSTP
jgi:peptidoglycan L-alanyl-D-glutamate endopeptidase CwlK